MSTPDASSGPPSPAGGPPPELSPSGPPAPAQGEPPAGDGQPGGTGDAAAAPEDHGVGSGDVTAEAISRPGQGSLRNGYLREADRLARSAP